MEREKDWKIDVIKELKKPTPISPSWSICKVRRNLRSVNEDAYTPHIVSIGPIHHKDQRLLPMEDHKRRYLLSLFNRTLDPELMLKDCCDIITGLDEGVRACYAEPIPYDKNQLEKILLHDAGFSLELFFRYDEWIEGIPQNDPIFTTSWMLYTLRRDLALLENQIPFFVLESLFNHIAPHAADGTSLPPLKVLACQFFVSNYLNISEEAFHLLHLLYNRYLPPGVNPEDSSSKEDWENIHCATSLDEAGVDSSSEEEWENIHCATSLDQAGVEFQKNTTYDLFDFQFHKGTGAFKIPQLLIDDSTDSLLRNLVAFEQSLPDRKHYITSYIFLMDYLIDTTKDVDLLQQKGIIENDLGSGGYVTDLFNNIGKQIVLKDFYFAGLCNKVNAHCKQVKAHRKRRWPSYKAALIHDYFKNPWSITSFVAAVILLVLTFLQTQYSLLSYYQKS